MSSLITLTTDFGTRDGYVAQMKGVILAINPKARLIDVTHDIESFDVMGAALVLKGVSEYFPDRYHTRGGGRSRSRELIDGES